MRYLQRTYGMSEEDARTLRRGGTCAICGLKTDRLHIDHNHATGRVRGLLCGLCNRGLGAFRDDPDHLEAAATYLKEAA